MEPPQSVKSFKELKNARARYGCGYLLENSME